MSNLERPSTSCQIQRPALANDDQHQQQQQQQAANQVKQQLSRSYTFENEPSKQQRVTKANRTETQYPRLGRSLLSNDNWRQETMVDVRVNAKAIEQSDQNVLFGKGKTDL